MAEPPNLAGSETRSEGSGGAAPDGAGAGVPRAARQRRPLPSPLGVITATLGLFFVVLTLLAIQVRNGRDPALGPGPAVPALTQGGAAAKGTSQQAAAIVTRASPAPPP
jgi:hypothetical protein